MSDVRAKHPIACPIACSIIQLPTPYSQLRSRVFPPNAGEEGPRAPPPFARWFFVTFCHAPLPALVFCDILPGAAAAHAGPAEGDAVTCDCDMASIRGCRLRCFRAQIEYCFGLVLVAFFRECGPCGGLTWQR